MGLTEADKTWTSMHWQAASLVVAQFVLAAALVLTTSWSHVPQSWRLGVAVGLLSIGSLIAVWAWLVMGLLRLRVMPHPAESAQLLRSGPYGLIRHPMYSGLLLASLGCLAWDFHWWRLALWCGLWAVLETKSRIEEVLLLQKFTEYGAYRQVTGRFLPFIY